jgi:hypothetical protein
MDEPTIRGALPVVTVAAEVLGDRFALMSARNDGGAQKGSPFTLVPPLTLLPS